MNKLQLKRLIGRVMWSFENLEKVPSSLQMANIILEGFERILVIGSSSSLEYLSYGGGHFLYDSLLLHLSFLVSLLTNAST